MPGITGLELATQVKSLNRDTEIIISSAFTDVEYLRKSIDIGISVFVTKPFDSKKMFSAIDRCWESVRLRKEILIKEEQLLRANADLEERVKEKTKML